MMRILLSTIGSRGDVQPLVAIALALQALDQEAHLCVPPDFCDWIESLGMLVTPIGPELRSTGRANPTAARPTPEQRQQMMADTVATQFETIAARPHSPELEAFLNAGEPPVYFGFGSIRAPENLSQVMITSARAIGRRAIVSQGWADLSLVDNEPDCLVIGEVNQQALFKRVAAVVHHGGAGTTTTAALAGVPQVVIPQMYDQHYWAKRIHNLGIGIAHAPGTPISDSLTIALQLALQPDMATRAQSIATTVQRNGAQTAAQRLITTAP